MCFHSMTMVMQAWKERCWAKAAFTSKRKMEFEHKDTKETKTGTYAQKNFRKDSPTP